MKKTSILLILGGSLVTSLPISVSAASQDECAIWLCLPTGFPSGCDDAKRAFTKRIKKLKPPLPNIASCLAKDSEIPPEISDVYAPSNLTYREGKSAKMPNGSYIDNRVCHYRKHKGEIVIWNPRGCTGTYRWIQTYMDGKPYGEKYYYNY
ncbi:conjugal transfer protein [Photobacterium leiognathi subsp. mandapamensis]